MQHIHMEEGKKKHANTTNPAAEQLDGEDGAARTCPAGKAEDPGTELASVEPFAGTTDPGQVVPLGPFVYGD